MLPTPQFHHFNPRLQPYEIQGDLDAMLALAERYDELRAIAAERAAAEAEAAAVGGGSDAEAMETEAQGQQQIATPLGAAKNAPPVVNSMQARMGLQSSPGAKPGLVAVVHQQAVPQAVA